ncbi:putative baseplate assembly protein [Luteibacter sp. OK325]|uniref:putative baseplate assembly protein n=1 Tax=Luteibacter sp. OK325 TaxID=2135670 RepID=UPI001E2B5B8B|nr:putative baseplate assembly protein [Luteibacter sp. OK325]
MPLYNRPGLDALSYRVGSYADFMATMQIDLSAAVLPALRGLRTRDPDDASIALLDAWAIGADVISFYQERIANEGYLRTATERCSVLQLGRLVDYRLRPGVSASVYLAYTLNSNSGPVTIPAGSKAQSVPAPGEQMQTFESAEALDARSEWNVLKPRLSRPQDIRARAPTSDATRNLPVAVVSSMNELWIAGTDQHLKQGDRLLFLFGDLATGEQAMRVVKAAEAQQASQITRVTLQSLDPATVAIIDAAGVALDGLTAYTSHPHYATWERAATWVRRMLLLGGDNRGSYDQLVTGAIFGHDQPPSGPPPVTAFIKAVQAAFGTTSVPPPPMSGSPIDVLFKALRQAPNVQPANSLKLTRSAIMSLGPASDARPQLLLNFESRLIGSFYAGWSGLPQGTPSPALSGVYVLRTPACLFGYNAVVPTGLKTNTDASTKASLPFVPGPAPDWNPSTQNESPDVLQLDNAYDSIEADSYVVIRQPDDDPGSLPVVARVRNVTVHPRTAYGMSGKTTEIALANDSGTSLWDISGDTDTATLRGTQVYAQSEPLNLANVPIDDVVGNISPANLPTDSFTRLTLDGAIEGMKVGRWVIVQGRRADVPGSNPVNAAELVMIAGIEQGSNSQLPGDTVHSTLVFASKGLAYQYVRSTVSIYANVVRATNGETRNEVLGNGDGTVAMPTFALKQAPLTFVSAPTVDGVQSTLKVVVNGVRWHEVDSLAGATNADRSFVTSTADDGKISVTFGDGVHGARVPTGIENLLATYRNGIGTPGNVEAGQISLLATKPLGVKDVINPLPATGGADAETRDQARRHVPLAVLALDRLVSVADYADFARTFGGVGKASAVKLGGKVWVTIAGAGDVPIDETSDLYVNLLQAMQRYGDPSLSVGLNVRELLALTLSAKIGLLDDFTWDAIEPVLRARLLERFGFERRELAKGIYLSEIIACMQGVRGVAWVDMDVFGSLDETAILTGFGIGTQDEGDDLTGVSRAAEQPATELNSSVPVLGTRYDANGVLKPAQLAYFLANVPDTLLLQETS